MLKRLAIIFFVLTAGCGWASGQLLTSLHSFSGADGANPEAGLVQGSNGNFYGTTYSGGTNNFGTVFTVSPAGTLTTLHSFTGGADGGGLYGALVQGGGSIFYGTSAYGGTNNFGTVFTISPAGTLTTLHSFTGGADDAYPYAGLVQSSNGNFYGTTGNSVFMITPVGTLTTLHSFTGGVDGGGLYGALVQGGGSNFYGTSAYGGTNNYGTVFAISPAGTLTTLHSFTGGADGAYPQAGLVQGINSNFYGTTYSGGTNNYGAVFTISPAGTLTTLHSFTGGADGAYPQAGLVQGSDSNFYGTTRFGGSSTNVYGGGGTVFMISPAGTLTTLHNFAGGADGAYPQAGLIQGSDGNFDGTTYSGGTNGAGTVFKILTSSSINAWVSTSSGKWEVSPDWSLGMTPSMSQSLLILITNANSKTVSIDAVTTGSTNFLAINNLNVSAPVGSLNTLAILGTGLTSPLRVLYTATISGGGRVSVTNGAVVIDNVDGGSAAADGLVIGQSGSGAFTMNGGAVAVSNLIIGVLAGSHGTLTVGGGTATVSSGLSAGVNAVAAGAVWMTGGQLVVANSQTRIGDSGSGQLVVSNGLFLGNNVSVGLNAGAQGTLTVLGGNLFITNVSGAAQLTIGSGGKATFVQSGGSVTVNQLLLTNGANSVFKFSGGLLSSGGTFVTNGQTFVVGNGKNMATLNLLGGAHSFANNLEISDNASLTGCGTINGNVVVDLGGAVVAVCGPLTFTGILTNNGSLWTTGGAVLESLGPVINNGIIYILPGGSTNFHSGFVNNGLVVSANDIPATAAIQVVGSDVRISVKTSIGLLYSFEETTDLVNGWTPAFEFYGNGGIETFIDPNATTLPRRFYRIGLLVPQ